jgi:release factor glutamine methyltransferase
VLTIRDALKQGSAVLRTLNNRNAEADARTLLGGVIGKDFTFLLTHPEAEIDGKQWEEFQDWIQQRASGKPIAYLVGHREFYGRDFVVSPAVLIPRPETELLIEQGLRLLRVENSGRGNTARPAAASTDPCRLEPLPIWIADIGTGSGCIAVTLAAEIPRARVIATDISEAALGVARENARRYGVADRVQFQRVDLLPRGAARLDAVFSNPPYVASIDRLLSMEVREHEPAQALFAGENGMEIYRRIVPLAGQKLKPGGHLLLELGYQSEQKVRSLFDPSLWQSVEVFPDLQGISRCLVARVR